MNIAFLTEMGFRGKVTSNYRNMRTEFSWMLALEADHIPLHMFESVKDYDHVFIIFPKGEVYLNAVGAKIIDRKNPISDFLSINFVEILKNNNNKVHYIQEGPNWLFNDYEIVDQINYYNMIMDCDSIFAHNECDAKFYRGLLPGKRVHVIRSLMIDSMIDNSKTKKENKTIIGGNFSRWYGGFQSYTIAQEFEIPIWAQTSHSKRDYEDKLPNINHFERLDWVSWIHELSSFKYAVHLMPTVAAGTFSMNCAYFGIPCIGNEKVDTQSICYPDLSVDVDDLEKARFLANKLKHDSSFYEHCTNLARSNYLKYYSLEVWKENIKNILIA